MLRITVIGSDVAEIRKIQAKFDKAPLVFPDPENLKCFKQNILSYDGGLKKGITYKFFRI